ncbi:hypothetical protein FGB62_369g03 [Gracilaria domingensis]|nr:hypothetical protein FGB62_369g03 [Gracilaria domingensis]
MTRLRYDRYTMRDENGSDGEVKERQRGEFGPDKNTEGTERKHGSRREEAQKKSSVDRLREPSLPLASKLDAYPTLLPNIEGKVASTRPSRPTNIDPSKAKLDCGGSGTTSNRDRKFVLHF